MTTTLSENTQRGFCKRRARLRLINSAQTTNLETWRQSPKPGEKVSEPEKNVRALVGVKMDHQVLTLRKMVGDAPKIAKEEITEGDAVVIKAELRKAQRHKTKVIAILADGRRAAGQQLRYLPPAMPVAKDSTRKRYN